jgi:hypothetical protein
MTGELSDEASIAPWAKARLAPMPPAGTGPMTTDEALEPLTFLPDAVFDNCVLASVWLEGISCSSAKPSHDVLNFFGIAGCESYLALASVG